MCEATNTWSLVTGNWHLIIEVHVNKPEFGDKVTGSKDLFIISQREAASHAKPEASGQEP